MGFFGFDSQKSYSYDQRVGASDNAQVAYGSGIIANPNSFVLTGNSVWNSGLLVGGRNNFVQLGDPNAGSKFAEALAGTVGQIVDKSNALLSTIVGSGNYTTTEQTGSTKTQLIIGAVIVALLAFFFLKRR